MPDCLLHPDSCRFHVCLARAAQSLLLGLQRAQCRLVLFDAAAKLKGQPIPVLLQMKQPLKHLPAVYTAQGQELGEFALRQHYRPGEVIHLQPDMLFHTAGNIRELIGHHNIAVILDLDEPADRIADRLLSGPLKFAFHPVTPRSGRRGQLEGEGYTELVLRMVHNPLSPVHCALHFPVHCQRDRIQQTGFAAAGRTKDPEQPGLGKTGKIYFLLLSIALQSG